MLALSYREVNAIELAYAAGTPADAATIRPLLNTWHRVEPGELAGLAAALHRLRAGCARPIRAITMPYWNAQRGRALSGWEQHYLRIADFAESPTQTPASLAALLHDVLNPLERLMIVAVCGQPALARRLAAAQLEGPARPTARTRWIAWLAGRELSADELAAPWSHPREGDPLTPNVAAAIRAEWDAVLRTSPKKALAVGGKPATDGHKAIVQLARFRLGASDAPTEAVLRASFGRWFGWSYHPHTSYELVSKAPHAYLFARELQPAAPEDAVAEIGRHIAHLKRPPAREQMVAESVRAHLDAFAALVDEAIARGAALHATRTVTGVELLLTD
ncbi:MAG: hypothetical protein KF901_18125 [Myxococcales bacterium]|nr:hypothetical protein [Myxococcales bacterium]